MVKYLKSIKNRDKLLNKIKKSRFHIDNKEWN